MTRLWLLDTALFTLQRKAALSATRLALQVPPLVFWASLGWASCAVRGRRKGPAAPEAQSFGLRQKPAGWRRSQRRHGLSGGLGFGGAAHALQASGDLRCICKCRDRFPK